MSPLHLVEFGFSICPSLLGNQTNKNQNANVSFSFPYLLGSQTVDSIGKNRLIHNPQPGFYGGKKPRLLNSMSEQEYDLQILTKQYSGNPHKAYQMYRNVKKK